MKSAGDIKGEAADWVIKIGDPDCTQEQLLALNAWLKKSSEHARQFHELRKIWHSAELPQAIAPEQAVDVSAACRGVIRAYHERYAESPEEVEQLVRDTYKRLISIPTLPLDRSRSVPEFLLTTARDLALARLRKMSVIPMDFIADIERLHALDLDQEIRVVADTDRNLSVLEAEYKRLPRRYLEALELRKMHGYSVAQISAQLGISEEEVKERLVKAVGLLGRALNRVKNADSRHLGK